MATNGNGAQFQPGDDSTDSGDGATDSSNGATDSGGGSVDGGFQDGAGSGGGDSSGSGTDNVGIDDPPDEECGYGTIEGVLCSKNSQQFVNAAKVWIETTDCDGNSVVLETVSDAEGFYTLTQVPSGTQTIFAKAESFERQYDVIVLAGQVTDITAVGKKECLKSVNQDCSYGTVTGYVCAPNGTLNIGGAIIYVEATDCEGEKVKPGAFSGADGKFVLENVPAKTVTVVVEKGSFKTQYEVTVPDGGTVHAPDVIQNSCFDDTETKVAVVASNFDSIEVVLSGLGIAHDIYNGYNNDNQQAIELLTNPVKLNSYDIVFFNCGKGQDDILMSAESAITQNLKTFVESGGSIYASDFAFLYVEWPWPDAIEFFGDDTVVYGPKVGGAGKLTAQVIDPDLAAHLGKDQVTLNFDEGLWAVAESAAADTKVHVSGNMSSPLATVSNAPLLLTHKPGAGKVLYTSFHNEAQVTADMEAILQYLVFEL